MNWGISRFYDNNKTLILCRKEKDCLTATNLMVQINWWLNVKWLLNANKKLILTQNKMVVCFLFYVFELCYVYMYIEIGNSLKVHITILYMESVYYLNDLVIISKQFNFLLYYER